MQPSFGSTSPSRHTRIAAAVLAGLLFLPGGDAECEWSSSTPKPTQIDVQVGGPECVSNYNWEKQQYQFKSATGYFVGEGGNIKRSSPPECSGDSWIPFKDERPFEDGVDIDAKKQPRMFLKDNSNKLIMIDMKTESISFTQYVGDLGRDFAGSFYATWVRPNANPAKAAELYCDANGRVGNNLWCPQITLAKANACGFRSAAYPVTDLTRSSIANSWKNNAVQCFLPLPGDYGKVWNNTKHMWIQDVEATNLYYCGLQVQSAQKGGTYPPKQSWVDLKGRYVTCNYNKGYGTSGTHIDTTKAYNVTVRFDWNKDGNYLEGFSTNLTQGQHNWVFLPKKMTGSGSKVPINGGFPKDGKMALLLEVTDSLDNPELQSLGCNKQSTDWDFFSIGNIRITNEMTKVERHLKFFPPSGGDGKNTQWNGGKDSDKSKKSKD
ncbi:hypothetical protein ACHAWF_006732 [Thalassiosira exigua]